MSTAKASPASDLNKQLVAIAELQPSGRLGAFVRAARDFSPEEFRMALPSTQMGPEGPVLVRVTLVSDSFFVDLHLNNPEVEFDFSLRSSARNYRVVLGEVSVKVGEQERRYQTARIMLLFEASVSLMAQFTYVGSDRASWLEQVKAAFPVDRLLRP